MVANTLRTTFYQFLSLLFLIYFNLIANTRSFGSQRFSKILTNLNFWSSALSLAL